MRGTCSPDPASLPTICLFAATNTGLLRTKMVVLSVRRLIPAVLIAIIFTTIALAVSVGSGSPTALILQGFLNAYGRNSFASLVTGPIADVRALGTPGYVQEFTSKANANLKYALVKPDPNAPASSTDTLQMYTDLYTFYTSVGVSTAGYPTNDTTACPTNNFGFCNYQLFTKDYALFVYSSPLTSSFLIKDPFYTQWSNAGGISGPPGPPTADQTTLTSRSTVVANVQTFVGATIFSYPSSSTTPSNYAVAGYFNAAYNNAGGATSLGFPTSQAVTNNTTGLTRQAFEYGRIELPMGSTNPNILYIVSEVDITNVYLPLSLSIGATSTVSATTLDLRGIQVNDRVLSWSSTNGNVAKITGSGYTATVTAVGGGTANIYVSSEGKTSTPLAVKVASVCCAVGEGAPSLQVTQAFQAAVSRNSLVVQLPAGSPVTRLGPGYVQTLSSADGSGNVYTVAEADGSPTAYVLSGSLYAAYLLDGGFTGPLGYPASDAAGGFQSFTGGAVLAGTPVHVIPAAIAPRWVQSGGVTGLIGAPVSDAVAFISFSGITGMVQSFSNGSLYGITSGAGSGKAYWSSGLILVRYLALSGPAGALGVPTGDVLQNGGVQSETFEAGYIDLQPGATVAVEHFNPRHPAVSVTPSTVVPGGRVHISATGFAPGATLSFTVTGQTGFSVTSPVGGYSWDIVIPPGAKPATVSIQATSKGSSDAAAGTYVVSSVAALLPVFTIISGDRQTGAPGSTLPIALVARLVDSTGSPIAGVPISYTVSPGAALQSSFVTDSNGQVSVRFRLPASPGDAVGSLAAGGKVVEFSALASGNAVPNFPAVAQPDAQSGFLTALSSLIAYDQQTGVLSSANGVATSASLSKFLGSGNGYGVSDSGTAIPNPWAAAQFANAGLSLEDTGAAHLLDLVGSGTPVLLLLNLTADGAPAGSVAVDAIGVNGDGSIMIADPNPALARTNLSDYLNGFGVAGHTIQGSISAVLRPGAVQLPLSSAPFIIASPLSSGAQAASMAGGCLKLDVQDPWVSGAVPLAAGAAPTGVRYYYCDGSAARYALNLAVSKSSTAFDLSGGISGPALVLPGNGTLTWQIARVNGTLAYSVQTLGISAITDSAAFAPALSPGDLFSIFGSGFSQNPVVTVGGQKAQLIAAFPFQINALIPASTPLGAAAVLVTDVTGIASQPVMIAPVSPGIFALGVAPPGGVAPGAIINVADGSINTPNAPATRGQFISIYCAGLGATALKAGLQAATAPVMAVVNGVTLPVSFAGLVPGFIGLFQVNLQIPAAQPPTLSGTVLLQQSGMSSNPVALSIQ